MWLHKILRALSLLSLLFPLYGELHHPPTDCLHWPLGNTFDYVAVAMQLLYLKVSSIWLHSPRDGVWRDWSQLRHHRGCCKRTIIIMCSAVQYSYPPASDTRYFNTHATAYYVFAESNYNFFKCSACLWVPSRSLCSWWTGGKPSNKCGAYVMCHPSGQYICLRLRSL